MKTSARIVVAAVGVLLLPIVILAAEKTAIQPKELRIAKLAQCDAAFESLEHEGSYKDMVGRDQLVNAWAECWKRSMNAALDERLLRLKTADAPEFKREMELQTRFNRAVEASCGKDCGPDGTMKGLPYNLCRVEAYKYRSARAVELNRDRLALPTTADWELKKDRDGGNDVAAFAPFVEQFCELPAAVWASGAPPADCKTKGAKELQSLRFTRDVCDLS